MSIRGSISTAFDSLLMHKDPLSTIIVSIRSMQPSVSTQMLEWLRKGVKRVVEQFRVLAPNSILVVLAIRLMGTNGRDRGVTKGVV